MCNRKTEEVDEEKMTVIDINDGNELEREINKGTKERFGAKMEMK